MNRLVVKLLLVPATVFLASCGALLPMGQVLPGQTTETPAVTQSPVQTQTSQQNQLTQSLGAASSLLGSGTTQGAIGNLLSGLLGDIIPVTQATLVGKWSYTEPDCRFESENYLTQAGGTLAATAVETKIKETLEKYGVGEGKITMTFNADQTAQLAIGTFAIPGTYTFDPDTKVLTFVNATGLLRLSPKVYYTLTSLTLLFDTDKLLDVMKTIGNMAGQKAKAINTLSSFLESYDGMQLGLNMVKVQ